MEEIEYHKMYAVEESHWWYVGLHELILSFIDRESLSKEKLEILDAGCGTGRLCQLMNSLGSVRGCDISDMALKLSTKRAVQAFKADLNQIELGAEQYDVITSIDVLYHRQIKSDVDVLKKFFRALKPGGLFILNLPAHDFLKSSHDLAVHTRERYSKAGIASKIKGAGFFIERSTYRIGFLFPFILLYRLMHRGSDKQVSDVSMPPRIINGILLRINRIENIWIETGFSVPFGSSIFIVARKVE